jgi:predicted dehydrogenase
MKQYNWGIIGAGRIAGWFAKDLALLPSANLKAIASRSDGRAAAFAKEFGIPKHYGSWQELAADPDIDIVYVATHHPFHGENTMECLNAGKAVLCEKPFTMNRKELEPLVKTARENKVFLMEAIWTRFLPSLQKVLELNSGGELGKLHSIYADLGFRREFDPLHRLFDPAKGGGALLDIGIYPAFISQLLTGQPAEIKASARFAETGIDHSCSMIFDHSSGISSSLNCTVMAESPSEVNLLYEKGRIRMGSNWHTPGPIIVYRQDREPERIEFPEQGNGYRYEAAEVMRCLNEGLSESPLLPLQFSLDLMGTLDRVREICGIRYAQDELPE